MSSSWPGLCWGAKNKADIKAAIQTPALVGDQGGLEVCLERGTGDAALWPHSTLSLRRLHSLPHPHENYLANSSSGSALPCWETVPA